MFLTWRHKYVDEGCGIWDTIHGTRSVCTSKEVRTSKEVQISIGGEAWTDNYGQFLFNLDNPNIDGVKAV